MINPGWPGGYLGVQEACPEAARLARPARGWNGGASWEVEGESRAWASESFWL